LLDEQYHNSGSEQDDLLLTISSEQLSEVISASTVESLTAFFAKDAGGKFHGGMGTSAVATAAATPSAGGCEGPL
jgi:hypothetical protein